MALRLKDVNAIDRRLPQLYSLTDLDEIAGHTVNLLATLIPCEITAYTETNPELKRSVVAADSQSSQSKILNHLQRFERRMPEHPVIAHYVVHPESGPMKVSDFVTLKEWKNTRLYQEFYRHIGVTHQMIAPIKMKLPNMIAITLNRTERDFNERERQILKRLQPHLSQVYANALTHTLLENRVAALDQGLESLNIGIVEIDPAYRCIRATEFATRCMAEYFPNNPLEGKLPEIISDWLDNSLPWLTPPASLFIYHDTGRLQLRIVPNTCRDRILLSMECYFPAESSESLQILGISPREADVLFWIAQGKTNGEIGIILGISPRTVGKHLESIYEILNVETRTGAAIAAMEQIRINRHQRHYAESHFIQHPAESRN